MGQQSMTDFVVDSNGSCFLCSSKISTQFSSVTLNLNDESLSPVQSLQYLSRYLNMDMTRVFSETEAIPTQLLAEVKSSRLKVELCQECSYLNKIFSQKYRNLEKMEMEVKSCVNLIRRKLSKLKKSDSVHQSDLHGKSKILKVLRTEAEEKCSSKLGAELPRLKLQKLSLEQVRTKKLKLKSIRRQREAGNSRALEGVSIEVTSSEVKMEISNSNFDLISSHDDNDANYSYFDGHDGSNDFQEEGQQIMNYDDNAEDADVETEITMNRDHPTVVNPTTQPKITIDKNLCTVIAETGKHKCNSCGKELKDFGSFKKHYSSIHLNIRYKCSMCGREFHNTSNYHRHVRKDHLGTRFNCQTCGEDFSLKYQLKMHQQQSSSCGLQVNPQ